MSKTRNWKRTKNTRKNGDRRIEDQDWTAIINTVHPDSLYRRMGIAMDMKHCNELAKISRETYGHASDKPANIPQKQVLAENGGDGHRNP